LGLAAGVACVAALASAARLWVARSA